MGTRNGNVLQNALTALVHSQATLTQTQAEFVSQINETNKRQARIETDLEQIKAILIQHSHVLAGLPDVLAGLPEAIRQKVGFKPGR